MMQYMKLRPIYFDKIKSGQKIYEVRLNDEKRRLLDVGDVIVFSKIPDSDESLRAVVKDLIYFRTFKEMADTLPLSKIGFEGSTKEAVEKIYHEIYSVENETKYGVVAIKLQLV